jgi:colanic acid biosynthesis glycosyl transferase WcaI
MSPSTQQVEASKHIVFVNCFAWPDESPTALLLQDVADMLVTERNYEVTVVCSSQTYAKADPGIHPPFKIIRSVSLPMRRSVYGRIGAWGSFYFSAMYHVMRLSKCDLVVTMTTPPFLETLGLLRSKISGTPYVIWLMDMYPEITRKMCEKVWLRYMYQVSEVIMKHLRKHANTIITLGFCMKENLVEKGIEERKITICENWARNSYAVSPIRMTSTQAIRILYSGNVGLAHEFETIVKALRTLSTGLREKGPGINLVVTGHGSGLSSLKRLVAQHPLKAPFSITFGDPVPHNELADHLGNCDIGLVAQSSHSRGCLVPSKFYGIVAAGRPVLYVGPQDTTVWRWVADEMIGYTVQPGDLTRTCRILEEIVSAPTNLIQMGRRAYSLSVGKLNRTKAITKVVDAIEDAISQRGLTSSTSC